MNNADKPAYPSSAELISKAPDLLQLCEEMKEALEAAVNGLEWRMDNDPFTVDKSDYEEIEKWKSALNKYNELFK